MPGLVPGIQGFIRRAATKAWMAGTSPAMTENDFIRPYQELEKARGILSLSS